MRCPRCGENHVPINCEDCGEELAQIDGKPIGTHPNFLHRDATMRCISNTAYPKEATMTQPALTKDQTSDLKSHIDRFTQTELALVYATNDRDQAKLILDGFIHHLEHPKAGK